MEAGWLDGATPGGDVLGSANWPGVIGFPDAELSRADFAAAVSIWAEELKEISADLVVVGAKNVSGAMAAWLGGIAAGHRVLLANPELPTSNLGRVLPKGCEAVLVGDPAWGTQHRSLARQVVAFDDLSSHGSQSVQQWRMTGSTVLLTSGTTGGSKAVVWPWAALRHSAETMGMVGRYGKDDVVATSLPLFHANALLVVFLAGLMRGSEVQVLTKFSASRFSEDMRSVRANKTSVLGSMAELALRRDQGASVSLDRMIIAPCDPRMAQSIKDRYGAGVAQIYGQTDIGICLWNDFVSEASPGVGRPLPGWEVCLDPSPASDRSDEGLELWVRNNVPGIAAIGYLNDPELTTYSRRDFWFHTGDLFRHNMGEYFYAGRNKDVIRTKGENVSSPEVESILRLVNGVDDVAVVGRRNDLGEEDVVAVVESERTSSDIASIMVREARDELPPYARPVAVCVVKDLPRTPTMKVSKAGIDLSSLECRDLTW